MSEQTPQQPASDVRQATSDTVREGVDIRSRVHDITLLALKRHRFDANGVKDVVKMVSEGMAAGAEKTRVDMKQALSEAFRGMDDAVKRSAEAGREALNQLAATGKQFSETELKQALATLKRLEEDFLATASHAAEAANEKVRPDLRELLHKARVSGTETGKQVAQTAAEFAQRFSVASMDAAVAGLTVASEFGARFAQAASGILSGIADSLAEKKPPEAKPGEAGQNDTPKP